MMILGRPAIGKFPAPLEVDKYLYFLLSFFLNNDIECT